jgi:hypothetical protein
MQTLFDKIWESHVVKRQEGFPTYSTLTVISFTK